MRLRSGLYVNIILVAFSLFILLPLAYCAIPWTSVVSMEISVQDQDGYPLSGAEASFLDAKGKAIGKIAGKAWVGGEQHVTWWTSSHYPDKSFMRPQDALSAKVAMISAPDCDTYRLPIVLEKKFESLSFEPHGGGPAYNYYRFDPAVKMTCRFSDKVTQEQVRVKYLLSVFERLSGALRDSANRAKFPASGIETISLGWTSGLPALTMSGVSVPIDAGVPPQGAPDAFQFTLYRKDKDLTASPSAREYIRDTLLAVIPNVSERICSKAYFGTAPLTQPPPLLQLKDGPAVITDSSFVTILLSQRSYSCAHDTKSDTYYLFQYIAERIKRGDGEWEWL